MINAIRRRLEDREEGFTLIELLVVVIIIGILAAVAIPVFLNQRERAWASAVQSGLRNAANEMETYYADHGQYPVEDDADDLFAEANVADTEVTLTVTEPTATGGQSYCITGTHTQIGTEDEDTWSYDSDNGGLLDRGTACGAGGSGG